VGSRPFLNYFHFSRYYPHPFPVFRETQNRPSPIPTFAGKAGTPLTYFSFSLETRSNPHLFLLFRGSSSSLTYCHFSVESWSSSHLFPVFRGKQVVLSPLSTVPSLTSTSSWKAVPPLPISTFPWKPGPPLNHFNFSVESWSSIHIFQLLRGKHVILLPVSTFPGPPLILFHCSVESRSSFSY
jgi:hypothetical protein